MRKFKAILFDWGGTLTNVQREAQAWPDCAAAAVQILARGGCQFADDAVAKLTKAFTSTRALSIADPSHKETRLEDVVRSWLAQLQVRHPEQATINEALDAFWQGWTHCLDPLDDADAVLRRLRLGGHETGLVSNVVAPSEYCIAQLKRLRLFEHLSTLTFSSEVGFRKPHKAIFEDAFEKMQRRLGGRTLQADDILFVGDSPPCDIAGAARFGMQSVLIDHPEIKSTWLTDDYDDIRPTYRITYLREVEAILSQP